MYFINSASTKTGNNIITSIQANIIPLFSYNDKKNRTAYKYIDSPGNVENKFSCRGILFKYYEMRLPAMIAGRLLNGRFYCGL